LSLLRNVATDLVAKRLWPVALVLLAALVAVPVVLGGGTPPAAAPVAAVGGDAGEEPGDQLLTLAEERANLRGTGERVDPFRRRPESREDGAPGGASVAGGGGTPAGTASLGGAVDAGISDLPGLGDIPIIDVPGGSGGPGGIGTKPLPEDDGEDVSYHVDVRVGRTGDVRAADDVARLSPLPSAEDPFLVFLGVAEDGESATFLLSSDAVPTGMGTCEPSAERCERIRMRAGDTEYFDVTTPEGEVVQYELEVRRIAREVGPTADAASAARARESAEGRALLRDAVAKGDVDISDLTYSKERGLVLPAASRDGDDDRPAFAGYRADLRYGPAGEPLVKRYNLARLTPLPSTEDPAFVFLGVLPGGEAALFLNPTGAAVSGDGVCSPDAETCGRIEVPAGGTATLDVPTVDGRTAEHRLAVDAITEVAAADAAEARAQRERESPAGRAILRRLIREVGAILADLDFDADRGTLTERRAGEEG
jgi:hypothetical protein